MFSQIFRFKLSISNTPKISLFKNNFTKPLFSKYISTINIIENTKPSTDSTLLFGLSAYLAGREVHISRKCQCAGSTLGMCCTLKRVMWYFEEGCMVL